MKTRLEDIVKINRLLDIYGKLLTNSQQEIMNDYYVCNLSLSEISSMRNISRTAVSDALKNSREKLDYYEEKLNICKVFDEYKEKKCSSKNIVDELEENIKNGIWIS